MPGQKNLMPGRTGKYVQIASNIGWIFFDWLYRDDDLGMDGKAIAIAMEVWMLYVLAWKEGEWWSIGHM